MDGKKRIIIAFCICVILLASVGGYSYMSTRKYAEAEKWVAHSQDIIEEAELIVTSSLEIEATQRGFVIAGDPIFLGHFDAAIQDAREAVYRLKYKTRDNPSQQRVLARLEVLVENKIGFATRVVNTREKVGFEPAQQIMMTNRGEMLKYSIHETVRQFMENEQLVLSQRLKEAQMRYNQVIAVIIIMVVLSIVIILGTLYLFIQDYSKRLRSEQQVRENELRFKNMLDSIPIGVFVTTAEGKPYFANRHSEIILGTHIPLDEPLDSIRDTFRGYIAGTDTVYPEDESPLLKALHGESTFGLESMEIKRGDERLQLRINAVPLFNSRGAIEFAFVLFEDITSVKKAERELINAKRVAEESLLLKETFLANMSHEIRTPMNAILGFTDLMLKEPMNDKEREYVTIIRTSGENLLRIINDILDLSKIEANMMEFEAHPLSISDIFRSLNTMLSQKAEEKKLKLTFENDPQISPTLIGDPTRLTQIIINLVGNAIKFTRKGSVTVKAKLLDEDMESCKVQFSITDTGIGIPPDKLNNIFERFRQAESFITRNYGGTGLGLSIARQLVELQGGSMDITSEVDKGSCFSFILRFAKPSGDFVVHTKEETTEVDPGMIAGLRILLAEDNPINVKLIMNIFEEYDMTVEVAENGRDVIRMLEEDTFDIVLMDLEMPVMNGYETTKYIRGEMQSGVPIIAMTAHAMAGEQERCLQLGMNDFVSKPINSAVLFEKMYQITRMPTGINPMKNQPELMKKNEPIANGVPANGKTPGKIDLSYLFELSGGNRDFEKEMLSLFMEQVPDELVRLRAAYEEKDAANVRNIAHKMKSSVPLVGADYLIPLLNQLEEAGLANELNAETDELMPRLITELEGCFSNVTGELESY